MFRGARCSSSPGGPIVSPQRLVSSPSVSSRTVCGWRADCQSALHPHTVRLLTEGYDTRGCGDTIGPPGDDEQRAPRNMLRSVMYHIYCWILKELCTKLVFWKVYTMMHGQKNIKLYSKRYYQRSGYTGKWARWNPCTATFLHSLAEVWLPFYSCVTIPKSSSLQQTICYIC